MWQSVTVRPSQDQDSFAYLCLLSLVNGVGYNLEASQEGVASVGLHHQTQISLASNIHRRAPEALAGARLTSLFILFDILGVFFPRIMFHSYY